MRAETPGENSVAPAYRSAPGVIWLKDAGQTIVVDEAAGRSWALRGLDAAMWDLLVLGYSFRQAARLLALLADLPQGKARSALSAMLQRWESEGLLSLEKRSRA